MEKLDVYEKIKNEIVYMDLEPGTSIGEIDTAKKYNISRTPIRDVFKKLSADGLLEIKSHVGSFVAKIDVNRILDTLYVREKVEISICKELMQVITPDEINKLEAIINKQEILIKEFYELERKYDKLKEYSIRFLEIDYEFHRTMFSYTNKLGVWNYLFENEQHYKRFRIFLNSLSSLNILSLVNEHRYILNAIIDKDEMKIEEVLKSHLYNGINNVKSFGSSDKYFKIS